MTGKVLRAAFWTVVVFIAWFMVWGVLIHFAARAMGLGHMPSPAAAAIHGAVLGAGTVLIVLATRRGWIKVSGTMFRSDPELEKRKAELAAERERLLAEAKAKARAAAETRGGSEPRLN